MSRKRRTKSPRPGVISRCLKSAPWKRLRLPAVLIVFVALCAGVALGAAKTLSHFDERVDRALLVRFPEATIEFPNLPEELAALAMGDLRGTVADVLELPWTRPERCREIAQQLSTVGWIAKVDSVQRMNNGRFEVEAQYRRPVALVGIPGKNEEYVLVDEQGARLPGVYVYHPRWYFIDGLDLLPPKVGERWATPALDAGLAVLGAFRGEPYRHQIAGVDVSNFAGRKDPRATHLELLTDRSGGRIRWGSAPGFEVEENAVSQKLALLRQNYARTGRADAGHPIIDISTFPDRFHIPG